MLRDYQQRAIDELMRYFETHDGDPCLVMPTGSGKSHVIAAWCKLVVSTWPDQRLLMLTHVRELIQQNAEKMRQHWPDAPMGIYSAGLRQRDLAQSITFAGIQSIAKRIGDLGKVDMVLIDEAHRINHSDAGNYRSVIGQMRLVNPALRVVGLTATPYRLGHGYITDPPALFTDLIEPIGVLDLMQQGFLAPLRSIATATRFDLSHVKKRGGEYVDGDLDRTINQPEMNLPVASEIVERAGGRKSWLIFCVSVAHAEAMATALRALGVTTDTIVGTTPTDRRDEIIRAFRAGEITALTNANVLTTGFDAPNVDLIAACRPTMSASLYVQMLGRGSRLKEHIKDCLVLDFAGLTYTHGFFDAPIIKKPKGETGDAPVKACPECDLLVATATRECPGCGFIFPLPKPPKLTFKAAPIMSDEDGGLEMAVRAWRWDIHDNGKAMLRVRYYPDGFAGDIVTEYFPVWHGGGASYHAAKRLQPIIAMAGLSISDISDAEQLQDIPAPKTINYRREGNFFRVISRSF